MKLKESLNVWLLVTYLTIFSVYGQLVKKSTAINGNDKIDIPKAVVDHMSQEAAKPHSEHANVLHWNVHPFDVNTDAANLLDAMNTNLTSYVVADIDTAWIYNTNITDENAVQMNEAAAEFSSMYYYWWVSELKPFNYTEVTDPYIRRQFDVQQSIGTAILNSTDFNALNDHINAMTLQLNNRVCPYDNQNCNLTTEGLTIDTLEVLMGVVKDYDELLYYWVEWRDVSGKLMLNHFPPYVDLTNEAATLNDFSDGGQMWLDPYTGTDYTSDDFKADIENIWQQLEPFYAKLHAYVRYRLMENPEYSSYINEDGLLPAHILGNMYAQSWVNIYDDVAPYPNVSLINLTPVLEEKITDVKEMFQIAEEFFTSLGMYKMTEDFWNNTLLEQPTDRDVVCHASAWDFFSTEPDNTVDGRFRIKMCTDKNQEDFITIHHEMGHIEYFMAYSNISSLLFRDGANPGFHEAIGDTISLSVSTPAHLQFIADMLNSTQKSFFERKIKNRIERAEVNQQDINFLMQQALDKVTFLPFAYIIDLWRWDAFAGAFQSDTYNDEWWKKRIDYQGLKPPVSRTNMDFDIGCKFHVPSNVPYIRYFVAVILQFQFHDRLCEVAGNTEPIYNCDIYNSTEAGAALLAMLEKGFSQQWQDTLAEFLNVAEGKMDASSILNYFDPLIQFLDAEILENNITVDWTRTEDTGPLFVSLTKMDNNLTSYVQQYVQATWDYYTDETEENLNSMNEASASFNSMYNYWWHEVIEPVNYTDVTTPYLTV